MKVLLEPDSEITGVVFDIQRYSLHDGPGLRTNIFLKGCGLHCWWCSNPEGRKAHPEIAFFEKDCFLCGDCASACNPGAVKIVGDKISWDSSKCDTCERCAQVCSSKAFRILGAEMTPSRVIDEVLRDNVFFQSNGGLTLTGGEPALQPSFAREILRLAKTSGIHTAIETCGAVPQSNLEHLLPFLDLILFDLKHLDPEIHLRMTGQDNKLILENLFFLLGKGANLIIRVPLIPGFNADEACVREMAGFIHSLSKKVGVHLLSYHTLGRIKYAALDRPYRMGDTPLLKPGEIDKYADIFRIAGILVSIDGS